MPLQTTIPAKAVDKVTQPVAAHSPADVIGSHVFQTIDAVDHTIVDIEQKSPGQFEPLLGQSGNAAVEGILDQVDDAAVEQVTRPVAAHSPLCVIGSHAVKTIDAVDHTMVEIEQKS